MRGNSCSEGHGIESRHRTLDGLFSPYFFVKMKCLFEKDHKRTQILSKHILKNLSRHFKGIIFSWTRNGQRSTGTSSRWRWWTAMTSSSSARTPTTTPTEASGTVSVTGSSGKTLTLLVWKRPWATSSTAAITCFWRWEEIPKHKKLLGDRT